MSKHDYNHMKKSVNNDFDKFVNFNGIQGCQTKMILGYDCHANVKLTKSINF